MSDDQAKRVWIRNRVQALQASFPQMSLETAEDTAVTEWYQPTTPAYGVGNWPPSYQNFSDQVNRYSEGVVARIRQPPRRPSWRGVEGDGQGEAQENSDQTDGEAMQTLGSSDERERPKKRMREEADDSLATEYLSSERVQAAVEAAPPNFIPFVVDRDGSIFGPRSQETLLAHARQEGRQLMKKGEDDDANEAGNGKEGMAGRERRRK